MLAGILDLHVMLLLTYDVRGHLAFLLCYLLFVPLFSQRERKEMMYSSRCLDRDRLYISLTYSVRLDCLTSSTSSNKQQQRVAE
jgi:hypothetical protein